MSDNAEKNMNNATSSSMSQDDVNNLFGDADTSSSQKTNKTGLELILDKAMISSTRFPMLEIIYDRYIRVISNSLRAYTSFNVDVEIEKMTTFRFGDYIDNLAIPSMISVVKSIEWDNFGLVVVDSPLTYSLVDVLFGGRKTPPSIRVEGRPYTSIELAIVQNLTEILLNDLSTSFEPVTPVTFQLDRVESNPKFATIARQEDVCLVLKINVRMDQRQGKIDIVFPFATIEPVKKILSKSFLGERGTKDPAWNKHFSHEIASARLNLEVVLNGVTTSMKDVSSFKVGSTIVLDKKISDDLFIKVNGLKVCKGKLGKLNTNMAVKLSEPINPKKFMV